MTAPAIMRRGCFASRVRTIHIMTTAENQRPSWDVYFADIARAVAARGDCTRSQVGAVIVKDHRIVSTGYNGSPSGGPSCLAGECPRGLIPKSITVGGDYHNCIALHAEQNAIAYASRQDTVGATIYIVGALPCDMCRKLIAAAGIEQIYVDPELLKGNKMTSVLQDWVMKLPLREQGVLLTAVRGCDDEPKQWTARGIADSPGRRLTGYIRWCFMIPADEREVDIPGAFFQSTPPDPFKPSEFGHLPLHWYTHMMHALEVIGYRHPDRGVYLKANGLYQDMVSTLHLNYESAGQMKRRLSEDRIASGTVVQ